MTEDLAARVEGLTGENSRHGEMTIVNNAVASAFGWVRVPPSQSPKSKGHWIAPEDCRDGKPVYDSLHGTALHQAPPPWLWSLDAAMTLVPDEHGVVLNTLGAQPAIVRIWKPDLSGNFRAKAATPALALTAAALRARGL